MGPPPGGRPGCLLPSSPVTPPAQGPVLTPISGTQFPEPLLAFRPQRFTWEAVGSGHSPAGRALTVVWGPASREPAPLSLGGASKLSGDSNGLPRMLSDR